VAVKTNLGYNFKTVKSIYNILNVRKYHQLIKELVGRDIKARYKQSILGYAWVIMVPVIHLSVMTIVFSYFIKVPTGGIPYPIYLFVALVPWMFFSNSITAATASLLANSQLITKIYFPREIFPLSAILAKTVDLFLSVLVLIGIMIYFKMPVYISILYVPVIFLFQFLFTVGVSLIISALNVFYRDIENVLPVLLLVWMYLTPVFYPPELIPENLIKIMNINPMIGVINSYRNTILYGVAPPIPSFLYVTIISISIFLIGFIFFRNKSRYFADTI